VLDCAPTDAALRLVTLPEVARGMVRVGLQLARVLSGVAVPVFQRVWSAPLPGTEVFEEAESLLYVELVALHARLTAPSTTARLVVTPERMVIDEARRTHTELALFEVACDAVVMNRLLPEDAAREPFFREWGRVQEERLDEVGEWFAPLPVLRAPLQEDEVTGLARLSAHAAQLFGDVRPEAVLCRSPRIRFEHDEGAYWARIPLPGADPKRLDVAKLDGDLVISTPARRRAVALPRRFVPLHLAGARLEAGTLHVRFERGAGDPAPVREAS